MQEAVKKEEEKVELPSEGSPVAGFSLVEEKKPEKKIVEVNPATPAPSGEAQEEQRAGNTRI